MHIARGAGCRIVERTTSQAGLKEVGLLSLQQLSLAALTRDNGDHIGSSADVIVGHFAINYHNEAAALGIDLEELYAAQIADAEVNPPEWNIQGRQANVYK
jgi:hypothetical protein